MNKYFKTDDRLVFHEVTVYEADGTYQTEGFFDQEEAEEYIKGVEAMGHRVTMARVWFSGAEIIERFMKNEEANN